MKSSCADTPLVFPRNAILPLKKFERTPYLMKKMLLVIKWSCAEIVIISNQKGN